MEARLENLKRHAVATKGDVDFFVDAVTSSASAASVTSAIEALSLLARTPSGRTLTLDAIQAAGDAFETALVAITTKDDSMHRALILLLVRIAEYKLRAVDAIDFMGGNASATMALLLHVLSDASLVHLEPPLVPALARVLHELTLPCGYPTPNDDHGDVEGFSHELHARAAELVASNGLHKVLNGPVFRHLNAGLLNAYSDSATLHLAMDSLLCTIESFALLLTDVPLRTSFVKHVLLSSGLLHDCLVPYFLIVLTLHPVSAAAHPTEPTWFQYKDAATGHPYYYNCKTHETRWQLPPGNCVTPARKIQLHVRCLTHWLRLMVALTFQAASIHTTASPLTAPYLHEWLGGLCTAVLDAPTSSATHPIVLFFLENGAAFHYFLSILINVDAFQHAMYNSSNQVARLLALLCAPLDTRTRFHAKCVLASKKGLHVLRDKLSFTLVLGLLQAPEVYFMAHPQALPQPKERWDQYIGNDGHAIYYYNVTTHESVWVLPPPLPPGWIVVWCEDYEQGYFYNSVTPSSSWERPAMTEPEPPSAVHLAAPLDATFEAYSERVMLEWVATAMQFRGRRRSVAPTSIGQHASGHRRPSVVAHNLDYQGLSRFHAPKMLPPVRDKKVFQQENGPKSPPAATIPAKFLCPINRSLMLEPMYSPETELTYEHQAIVHVVQDGAGVCPVTQRSVDLHKLVLNTKLQQEIRAFQTSQVEDDAVLAP